ncbi:MAG: YdbH domain-containing protein [Steroidobacteraceae bacterium]
MPSEAPYQAPPDRGFTPRVRVGLRLLIGFGMVMVTLAAAMTVLYMNRRAVAQHVLAGWLERRGIESEVEIERLERDGLVARVRLGARSDPEVLIEQLGIDYALSFPWSATGLGFTLGRVRLQRPMVRARWHDGKLSLGSIDPLLRSFLEAPPSGSGAGPEVTVQAGELRLSLDQGSARLLGDARLEGGRLLRLSARLPSTSLIYEAGSAQAMSGTLDVTTTGERVAVRLEASAAQLAHPSAGAEAARLRITADLPYPQLQAQRADGPVSLEVDFAAAQLRAAAGEARAVQAHAAFEGASSGGVAALSAAAAGSIDVRADEVTGQGGTAQDLHATLATARVTLDRSSAGLRWSVKSPTTLAAGRLIFGELSVQQAQVALNIDVAVAGPAAFQLQVDGSAAAANGAWPLLGAPLVDDLSELVQLKRALRNFSISAPGLRLEAGSAGTSLALTAPVRLMPANGGALVVEPAVRPLYEARASRPSGGALRLTASRGRGLPAATFNIPDWHFTEAGFQASLQGNATLDFNLARGITFGTRGVLALAGERISYTAEDCLSLRIERLELDENDATGVTGMVCPDGGPLFSAANGSWQVRSAFRDVAVAVPAVAMRFADLHGKFLATSAPDGLGFGATVASGQAIDTTAPARFNPVQAAGSVTLQHEHWNGAFDLAAGSRHIGRMTLLHNATTATGGVRITVPELAFAEGGLQPAGLSALAGEFVQSPATGAISFEGRIDWAGEAASTSSGRLRVPGLDFASPAGAVQGLKGQIEFTSLTPLTTAPDQTLSVARLVAATEITGLKVVFALDAGSLRVAAGELHAAGGRLFAMPFAIPLDLTQPFSGTLVIETLQLGKVLADAGLADKLALDAVVSGSLPFAWTPGQGVRIVGGTLAAVQPGRLTLKREMLDQVQTSAAEKAPPGMVEDLAFQALENLSFETLSVDVNSLDKGRVGLVFKVKGRHDPPQHQELRVGLLELISRKFMQRRLPLPSDTRIDLTLDTTLNLNQLISDLLEVQRARQGRGSAPAAPLAP